MRRLILLGSLLVAVIAGGAAWYTLVEGFSPLDGVYQAVTTLSTVGFEEVHPLDTSGRIFTIIYILGGVGLLFYTATTTVEMIVVGSIGEELGLRRANRKVHHMQQHYVICGYGRVGREVAHELATRHEQYVVIDRDEPTLSAARGPDVTVVHGDATEEATLRTAGVERARALVAAADSDVENTYIVLTARALNPALFIVARAGTESAERRLLAAGANRVISPYRIGGRRMALSAVQPMLMEFMDTLVEPRGSGSGNVLAEIEVGADATALAGRTIAEAFPPATELHVMGLERTNGRLEVGPPGNARIEAGDRLILYGEQDAIARLSAGTPASVTRRGNAGTS